MHATLTSAVLAMAFTASAAMSQGTITRSDFGKLKDGRGAELFTLTGGRGVTAKITNFGGIIVSFTTPDRDGKMADIVLGHDTLAEYLKGHPFFGCLTGRYANRIAKGRFTLDGKEYSLHVNNGPNSLHGGKEGFDKKLWRVIIASVVKGVAKLVLTYQSPDGEEGYPGSLNCHVTYSLGPDGALQIDYTATTDKPTVVNLTNHSYFNLGGHGSGPVTDHVLQLFCSKYTDTDADLIPTGAIKSVEGTPLDFRQPVRIGARIDQKDFVPLKHGEGYDHNFVIDGEVDTLRKAALMTDPKSGRTLECLTTEPAVQLYTANHMSQPIKGKGGATYEARGAFCLETQHYPDSPNHPEFPSTVLRPGETYRHTCVYRPGVAK